MKPQLLEHNKKMMNKRDKERLPPATIAVV